jgi:hypothetical protein
MKTTHKEIIRSAKLFEQAYQENDEAFFTACDHILSTALGKDFFTIQQQYLTRAK